MACCCQLGACWPSHCALYGTVSKSGLVWGHQLWHQLLLLHAGSLLIEAILSACSAVLLETLHHLPAGN